MVGHHDIDCVFAEESERFLHSRAAKHSVTRMLQNQLAEVESRTLVVNGQN